MLDATLTKIIPSLKNYDKLAKHVEKFIDALDDLQMASKRCVGLMERQRKSMFMAAQKMVILRDAIKEKQHLLTSQATPQEAYILEFPSPAESEEPTWKDEIRPKQNKPRSKAKAEIDQELEVSPIKKRRLSSDDFLESRGGHLESGMARKKEEVIKKDKSEEEGQEYKDPFSNQRSLQTMQQSALNFKNFMGSRVFTNIKLGQLSRDCLPHMRPEYERLPLF